MSLIKCPECGKEISDKAASCPNCGCPMEVKQDETGKVMCPNCGEENEKDAVICRGCGHPLVDKDYHQKNHAASKETSMSDLPRAAAKGKWSTGKLVIGIITLVFAVVVGFQSCAAGLYNSVLDSGERSGSFGFITGLLFIAAGTVGIVSRNSSSIGGPIACTILYWLSSLEAIYGAGSYKDLKVWGTIAFAFGTVFMLSLAETVKKRVISSIGAIAFFILLMNLGSYDPYDNASKPVTTEKHIVNDAETVSEEPINSNTTTKDYSNIEKKYVLMTGYYTAGIDIPSGRCNIEAINGTGSITSSNLYDGGINEMFGIDEDDSEWYIDSFSGLRLPEGTSLEISGNLTVGVEFTQIDGDFKGRNFDEDNRIELSSGNYISGIDFSAGVYSIRAVSGTGDLSSSNMYDGGIIEMFGIDDGSGWYTPMAYNISLPDGVELSVDGGLVVELIPSQPK